VGVVSDLHEAGCAILEVGVARVGNLERRISATGSGPQVAFLKAEPRAAQLTKMPLPARDEGMNCHGRHCKRHDAHGKSERDDCTINGVTVHRGAGNRSAMHARRLYVLGL
jgi:hypothetical protein